MQLNDYLKQNSISVKDFAASARLSLVTIYKYISGERKPTNDAVMLRIFEATNGQVTANDFYDLPAPPGPPHTNGKHRTNGS